MPERVYYSRRTGKTQNQLDIGQFRTLFHHLYDQMVTEGCFDLLYGIFCVDDNLMQCAGAVGHSPESFFLLRLRKDNIHPIEERCEQYEEGDLFDVIELLYDHAQKRSDGGVRHHWCACGGCQASYDKTHGQEDFRARINEILRDYRDGFELSEGGEILAIPEPGLELLLKAPVPECDQDNVEIKIQAAKHKFRSGRSTLDDRHDAVRALADVLEFLRPRLDEVLLGKDDAALFNIANNYGVRHHNAKQKTDYDRRIWLDWMFCFYLSTIHAVLRLLKRKAAKSIPVDPAPGKTQP